jgi:hypothetical protein
MMVRYYPSKREDLLNRTKDNVKPYSLLAAVIADCKDATKNMPKDVNPFSDSLPFITLAKQGRVIVVYDYEEDEYDRVGS